MFLLHPFPSVQSCLYFTQTGIAINETVTATLASMQYVYYLLRFPSQGVTIRLNVTFGSIICFASTTIPNPDEFHYDWKIETDMYADAYLDRNESIRETLFVSLQGVHASNSFAVETVVGDFSTKGQ